MAAGALVSCQTPEKGTIIGKSQLQLDDDRMTTEVMWSMGRVSDIQVSPDGRNVLYGVQYYSIPENKGNRELFLTDLQGNSRCLTRTAVAEQAARWSPDGQICYLAPVDGVMQLFVLNPEDGKSRCLTDWPEGLDDFQFSPDGRKLLFVSQVKYGQSVQDIYPDLDKSSGRVINDLMYKHWDEWVETIPHPFVADFSWTSGLSHVHDLLENEPYESPMKPFGGIEQLCWSPDSKTVAYTCRRKTGVEYARSTNSDIYLCHLDEDYRTENLTEGMMGYDTNPLYSPSGRYIAFSSMEREGYESDKNRLMLYDSETGLMRDLTLDFDQEANSLAWNPDESEIYFVSIWHARTHIYAVDIHGGQIRQLTEGDYDYENALPAEGCLVAMRHSISAPNDVFRVDPDGNTANLSRENESILSQLEMGKVEERWIETTNGEQMLTWVIYPPHFDPSQKYPALLYCQGGPQDAVSQFWSFRWNYQLMAANGYIIVAPNRHGLQGFGQAWLEQISGDYGGQNMEDYLAAIDAVSAEPYVDADRLGCVGASYGGFSVYWLAGHHQKRFKAFIAHSGIFNLEQQYVETEEMWFADWDLGGAYWDKDNAVAQRSFANSPHKFIDLWDTPILCIHGERDYRILASQGMAAFDAARLRGIDAQLLVFPDENHWISKPQNAVLWQRTFFAWLDKYLK